MRWLVASAVLFAVLAFEVRPAAACSCGPKRAIRPVDGATAVPLNAHVLVHARPPWPNVSFRLVRVADGLEVATDVTVRSRGEGTQTLTRLVPRSLLDADTGFRIEMSAPVLGTSTSQFTTGAEVDNAPPAYGGIDSIRFETLKVVEDTSACIGSEDGWHGRILADFGSLPLDAAFVEVELFQGYATESPVDWLGQLDLYRQDDLLGVQSTVCSQRPPRLEPNDQWCARATAYDLAGNGSGSDQLACSAVVYCESIGNGFGGVTPCEPRGCGCSSGSGAPGTSFLALGFVAVAWLRDRRSRCEAVGLNA